MSNDSLFAQAQQVIPGGVDSPVRAFGSVGGTPRFIERAFGPYIVDAEGTQYVDLVNSWGPALLGHSHPDVLASVHAAVDRGLSFGAATEGETLLAEAILRRVPILDKLRFVSTGTEATMTAIRLARGATGRPLIVKFAGHYHGHSDGLLADAGSGLATFGLPGSAGVTEATAAQTLVVEYNNLDALNAVFAERGDQIAGVIMEAAAANMGVVAPLPGFNKAVTELAHANGSLLILDEVLTGFRVSAAGYWGIDGAYTPDLMTFGKVIGGGMPVAAVAGSAEIMDLLAPTGPVYQAGTLSGNPVAVAAGLATLRLADAAVYERVNTVAATISSGLDDALTEAGVPHIIQHAGNLFSVVLGDYETRPVTYAAVKQQEAFRYTAFFHSMLHQHVALPPSVYEAWFVSAAYDDAAIDAVLSGFPAAARAAAEATA